MNDFILKIILLILLFIGVYQVGKQGKTKDKNNYFYAWFFLVFGIIIYFVIEDFSQLY